MRSRLTLWRRRWCVRRGHPLRKISVVSYRYTSGNTIEQFALRCRLHDVEASGG